MYNPLLSTDLDAEQKSSLRPSNGRLPTPGPRRRMSHEIPTPNHPQVNGILGMYNPLLSTNLDAEQAEKLFAAIQRQIAYPRTQTAHPESRSTT
jgi:hypothetical protein